MLIIEESHVGILSCSADGQSQIELSHINTVFKRF